MMVQLEKFKTTVHINQISNFRFLNRVMYIVLYRYILAKLEGQTVIMHHTVSLLRTIYVAYGIFITSNITG